MAGECERTQVGLAEIVAASALDVDLGFGQPIADVSGQYSIVPRLAEDIGLDEEQRAAVYYIALLINIGWHSDAHEQALWFGDDIAPKATQYGREPRSLRKAASSMHFLGSGNPPLHLSFTSLLVGTLGSPAQGLASPIASSKTPRQTGRET